MFNCQLPSFMMSLRKLKLQDCCMSNKCKVALFKLLTTSTCIEILNFDGNDLSDDLVVAAACTFLTANRTLTHLGIGSCFKDSKRDGKEIFVPLSDAFGQNQTLIHLDLAYNGIKDEEAEILCEALGENQSLKEMDLRRNNITRLDYFEDFLERNKTLEKLIFGNMTVNDVDKVFDLQLKFLDRSIIYAAYEYY